MTPFSQHAYKPKRHGALQLKRMHPRGETSNWCLVGESHSLCGPENIARLFLWTGKPEDRPQGEEVLVGIVGSAETDGLGRAARRLRVMARRFAALNEEIRAYAAGAYAAALREVEQLAVAA